MKKAIIDIDGVLNYYPQTFVKFVNDMKHTSYQTLKDIKASIPYDKYKVLKEAYRKSTYKHDTEIQFGAHTLLKFLKENNYLIYIITARELFKYNQLELTIKWLTKNDLDYDYIYCTQKKDFTIFEKFGHVDLVVDDNCDNCDRIKKINGDKCLYINVINNDNYDRDTEAIRVNNLEEVIDILKNNI